MDLHVQMKMKLMAAMNWLSHRCQVVIMTPVWQKEIAGKRVWSFLHMELVRYLHYICPLKARVKLIEASLIALQG